MVTPIEVRLGLEGCDWLQFLPVLKELSKAWLASFNRESCQLNELYVRAFIAELWSCLRYAA